MKESKKDSNKSQILSKYLNIITKKSNCGPFFLPAYNKIAEKEIRRINSLEQKIGQPKLLNICTLELIVNLFLRKMKPFIKMKITRYKNKKKFQSIYGHVVLIVIKIQKDARKKL